MGPGMRIGGKSGIVDKKPKKKPQKVVQKKKAK
jgi:hypothetical protein